MPSTVPAQRRRLRGSWRDIRRCGTPSLVRGDSFFSSDLPVLTCCLSLLSLLLYASCGNPATSPADHGGRTDLFVCSFASTWGPCSWTYASELTPLRVRAKAVSFATATNWVCLAGFYLPCVEYLTSFHGRNRLSTLSWCARSPSLRMRS